MAASEELISLVVPVHNLETRLPKCLESISAQTYRNLEIILVDDGSTDGSGKVCDDFAATDPRVRVIHQENRGVASARNRGVAESTGAYLMFPDGDDYFHKDYVRLLYEAINAHGQEYPLAMCDFARVEDFMADTQSDSCPEFEEMSQEEILNLIKDPLTRWSGMWGGNWNNLYRRSVLPEPFQRDFARCQDFDTTLFVLFKINRVVFVPKVLYYWVQWPGQRTRSSEDMQIRNECRCQIYYDHFKSIPAHLSYFRPYLLINLYKRLIFWKECARGTSLQKDVFRKIRDYERKTFIPYWTCREIPFSRKIRWKMCLHAPSLLRLLGLEMTMELV